MVITTKEYREGIARQFTQVLEEKQLNWKKGWNVQPGARPENAISHSSYKGINHFYLMLTAMAEGYQDPRWATFKQIKEKGWHLQKDSKGVKVEYWFPYDIEKKKDISWDEYRERTQLPDENTENLILRVRYFTVFNGDRIEGIPELPKIKPNVVNQDHLIESLSKNMGVEILNDGGDRAFYRPSEDKIHLPAPEQFHSEYDYNATALHELAHSTGAAHRLNRDIINAFGGEGYAYEELVAEISSCFMGAGLQAEQNEYHVKNHQAYVQSWVKHIQEKPEALIVAIKDAEKAADYMECYAELIPTAELDKTLRSSCYVSKNAIMAEEYERKDNMGTYENVRQLAEKTENLLFENHKNPILEVENIVGPIDRKAWVNMLEEDLTYGASWVKRSLANLQEESLNPDARSMADDLCKEIDNLDVVYGQKLSMHEGRRELTQQHLNVAITEAAKRGNQLELPNCFIMDARLRGDLTGANFTNTYFAGNAKFENVNLTRAEFQHATIQAEVNNANFKYANFHDATIRHAHFRDSILENVDFTGTSFAHVTFRQNTVLKTNDYLNAAMNNVYFYGAGVEGEQMNANTITVSLEGATKKEAADHRQYIFNNLKVAEIVPGEAFKKNVIKEFVDIRGLNHSLNSLDGYNIQNGRSEYIPNPVNLERLTKEGAEAALDKGVRIGYASDHMEYHGTHQDEYEYHAITSKDDLAELFENHASVSIDPIYRFSSLSPNELKMKIMDKSCGSNNTFFYGREIEVKDGYRKILQEDLDHIIDSENKVCNLVVDFDKCHFDKVSFHDQLLGGSFVDSIMEHCTFQNADLVECNFTNCRIDQASICDSLIRHSRSHNARFVDCDFKNTTVTYVDFEDSYFQNTKMSEKVVLGENNWLNVTFENTSLKNVEIKEPQLNLNTTKYVENNLTPELRKKLQELERGGHHFKLDKGGKVTVPEEAKKQLTPGEIEDVTGYIKDSRVQLKEPVMKNLELEA